MLNPCSFLQILIFVICGLISFVLFLFNITHVHLLLIAVSLFILSYTIYKTDRK